MESLCCNEFHQEQFLLDDVAESTGEGAQSRVTLNQSFGPYTDRGVLHVVHVFL